MTTLHDLHNAMQQYNADVAPGSECAAWNCFVADCEETLEIAPWSEEKSQQIIPEEFANYWMDVTTGDNPDFHADGSET